MINNDKQKINKILDLNLEEYNGLSIENSKIK